MKFNLEPNELPEGFREAFLKARLQAKGLTAAEIVAQIRELERMQNRQRAVIRGLEHRLLNEEDRREWEIEELYRMWRLS